MPRIDHGLLRPVTAECHRQQRHLEADMTHHPNTAMTLAEARDWLAMHPAIFGEPVDLPPGVNSVEAHLATTWTITLDTGEHASMTRPIQLADGGTYVWVR